MYHLVKTKLKDEITSRTGLTNLNISSKLINQQINEQPSILTHDWFPLQERLPRNLAHFATIRMLNCVFVIGGLDINYLLVNNERKQVRPISNCYALNLTTSCWFKIKSMNLSRAFHCAVKYENLIYVFGGITYHTNTNSLSVNNTMEFYDLSKNLWFLLYDRQTQPNILPSPR